MKSWLRMALGILAMAVALGSLSGCGTLYSMARDVRPVKGVAADMEIAAQVHYDLVQDEIVKRRDISIYCYLGKVFLVGAVDSEQQKERAVAIARKVKGVKSVETYFLDKVPHYVGGNLKDTAITTRVKSELFGDNDLKSTQFEVKTIYRNVIILGLVAKEEDRDKAIQHAREIPNVKSLKSFILVK